VKRAATWTLVTLASLAGCSAIGDPGGSPDGLPHGGTGQFRLLDQEETGIVGSLPGRAVVLRGAVGSAMRVESSLFYAGAAQVDEPPTPPEDHPPNEVFDPAFGPYRIHRGALREEGTGAFDAGPVVLEASEAWEGEDLFDPWVVVDEDGGARLYYAAAGGVGLATADSLEGTFQKQPGPVLAEVDGATPRRPSVVRAPGGGFLMYFDLGASRGVGALGVARSSDGVRFEVQPLEVLGEDAVEAPFELARSNPGAVRVETVTGRVLIRVYYESLRDDGGRLFYMMASEDGLTFDRFPRPVLELPDARLPAPYLVDDRVTFLYANLPFVNRGFQTRGVVVSVAPRDQRFDPPEEDGT
jgi:hypothetical protein